MKQRKSLLKLAALVSASLLVGGFVGYRAGAISWVRPTSPPPADSASDASPDNPQFIYSTKSAPVFQQTDPSPSSGDAKQVAETFMGGSKSIVFPVIPPKQQGTPPPANAQPPVPPKP